MPVETKEFIWLTNDLVFKYVFSHEEILMDFLNSYLEFVGSDLRVLNAHITPQKYVQNDHINLHDCYLDICVVLSNREIINIEMYNNFFKKSLTYASMLYSHQLKKKEPYENAKKVTSLNIMRGNFNEENNNLLNKYELINLKNHKKLLEDGLEMLLLRLDILEKEEYSKDNSRCIRWLKFMNVKSYEEAEELAEGDKYLMSTVEMVRDFVSDPEIRSLFDRDKLKEESAELRGKEAGIKEGLIEGKNLGLIEGKNLGIIETAKNMLKKNCDINLISEVTNLSTSDIKKLV